jgi:hypothetical protein
LIKNICKERREKREGKGGRIREESVGEIGKQIAEMEEIGSQAEDFKEIIRRYLMNNSGRVSGCNPVKNLKKILTLAFKVMLS